MNLYQETDVEPKEEEKSEDESVDETPAE